MRQCNDIFTDQSIFRYFSREIGQFQSTWARFGEDKTLRPHVNMSASCRHVNISPCSWLQLVTEVPVGIWIRDKFKLKIDRSVKTPWQEYEVVAGSQWWAPAVFHFTSLGLVAFLLLGYLRLMHCILKFTLSTFKWSGWILIISIPLHFPRLHFMVCCVTFPHLFPPPEGGGLVQVRVRVFFPLPQVLSHAEYSDHSVNPPLTKMVLNKTFHFHCPSNQWYGTRTGARASKSMFLVFSNCSSQFFPFPEGCFWLFSLKSN